MLACGSTALVGQMSLLKTDVVAFTSTVCLVCYVVKPTQNRETMNTFCKDAAQLHPGLINQEQGRINFEIAN
jgi:hypothetical protein